MTLEKYPGDVSGLQKQAEDLQTKGYYDKAITIIKEMLALRREASGGSNAEVAKSLHWGILYALLTEYDKAEFFCSIT